MIGILTRPRWMLYLVLAMIFAVAAVWLGQWQYGRHEARVERRDTIEANYGADPVPLTAVLTGADDAFEASDDWTRVEVTGRYLPEDQLLVRNRPYRSVFGYEVLVPFEVDALGPGAADLLVNRGWVENARNAATLPEVPEPPTGEVTITGWLRPSEEDLGRDLPVGQVASINLPVAEEASGDQLFDAYLALESEAAGAPVQTRPAQADPPDTGLGTNFAYALQWWLFSPIGVVLVVVMARREARDEADADPDTFGRPTLAPATVGARKKRIWDEEDYEEP
ncbi:MAG: SURF1 family protein [Ornithinimicrobium sp.]